MRNGQALAVGGSLLACVFLGLACSSPSDSPATPSDAGADVASPTPPDAGPAPDGASATDAPAEASAAPVTGTLDVRVAGTLPTTVRTGAFAPTSGSAQWRARPSGGGILTVRLDEAASGMPSRSIELTVYDDAGSLDANEAFDADAAGGFATRRARVETYQGTAGWRTNGDGKVTVLAFDGTSVKLQLANVGQFTQESAGTDVFVVDGTVTVPLVVLAATATGTASLAISNLQNEPIGGEACNLTSPAQALAAPKTTLDDFAYPFTAKRRAAAFSDLAGAVKRNLRIAFPSGHLPRLDRSVSLSKFDHVQVTYFEGATLSEAGTENVWEADNGMLHVDAATATSMTLRLEGATMQSESPAAKGTFTLDGTVTIALP